MKKLLAVMALIVVVFTIGAAVVNANVPGPEKFQECHEMCLKTIPTPKNLADYQVCMDMCMGW